MKDEWSSLRFQLSKGKGGSPHAPPFIYLRPWYKMMVLYNWINLKVEVSSCNLDGWRQIFQFPFIYSSIHPSFIIGETDVSKHLYSQICFLNHWNHWILEFSIDVKNMYTVLLFYYRSNLENIPSCLKKMLPLNFDLKFKIFFLIFMT